MSGQSRNKRVKIDPPAAPRAASRRAFMQGTALVLGGLATNPRLLAETPGDKPRLQVGLVTDIHHADKEERINRYYRHSLDKLTEAIDLFNDREPAFVAQLGDLIDAADSVEKEIEHITGVEKVWDRLRCERHYVIGNHCVDILKKEEFTENTPLHTPHYAFDRQGIRFITLDSCYRSDGEPYGRKNFEWTDPNIPADQLDWLRGELEASDGPVVILAHQRLDGDGADNHFVNNAAEVRGILENAGNVLAVFQGHSHRDNYEQINGIHYCTCVAMVEGPGPESSAYAMLSIYDDTSMKIEGFRRQPDRTLAADA